MPKIEIKEPESVFEAGMFIYSGAYYLLVGKKDKRSWALIGWSVVTLLYFSVVEPAIKTYLTDRVRIEVAQPIKAGPTSEAGFSINTTAYAGDQAGGSPIKWAGQLWGYSDTNFVAFKLYDKDAVLLYDKRNTRIPPYIFTIYRQSAK